MKDPPQARSVTLKSRKPLAPPFHRHIARGKLMNSTCRVGDAVVIYDVAATDPPGDVLVTESTDLVFG